MLIVFGGLPGVGKSTLAAMFARAHRAVYLRIDTIEQAIRSSGALAGDVGPAGYVVAYNVAEVNLRFGLAVVADSVNPLPVTRDAWRRTAAATSSDIVEVEIICSDPAEHRCRVESRVSDVPDLVVPTWEQVRARDYATWDRPHVVLDTANRTIGDSYAELCAAIAAR